MRVTLILIPLHRREIKEEYVEQKFKCQTVFYVDGLIGAFRRNNDRSACWQVDDGTKIGIYDLRNVFHPAHFKAASQS